MRLVLSAACLALVVTACSGESGQAAPNAGVPSAMLSESVSATPGETGTPSDPASKPDARAVDTRADSCKRVLGPDRSPIEVGVELVEAQAYGPEEVRAARYAAQILLAAHETAPPSLRKLIRDVLELPQAVVEAVDTGASGFSRDVPAFTKATRALVEACRPYATD